MHIFVNYIAIFYTKHLVPIFNFCIPEVPKFNLFTYIQVAAVIFSFINWQMFFCKFSYDSDLPLHFNDSYSVTLEMEKEYNLCLFVSVVRENEKGCSMILVYYSFLVHTVSIWIRFITDKFYATSVQKLLLLLPMPEWLIVEDKGITLVIWLKYTKETPLRLMLYKA